MLQQRTVREYVHRLLVIAYIFFCILKPIVVHSEKLENCVFGKFNLSSLDNGPWKISAGQNETQRIYLIELCHPLKQKVSEKNCEGAIICRIQGQKGVNIGNHRLDNNYELSTIGNTFSLHFKGSSCSDTSKSTVFSSVITFSCGPTLGSPELLIESTCESHFSWKTSAACVPPPSRKEVPCYVFDSSGRKRDLTSLIKQKGAHAIRNSNSATEFFINVCSDIIADENTKGCPNGASACRKIGSEYLTFGEVGSALRLTDSGTLMITYLAENARIPAGCNSVPKTTVIFKCPPRGRSHNPRLISIANCHYVVEWETEHACPEDFIKGSINTCSFNKGFHGADINLSPLRKDNGYYVVPAIINASKSDFYLNVCGGLGQNFKCGKSQWNHNSVCLNDTSANDYKITGKTKDGVLRYADGNITLIYLGDTCIDGNHDQTTVINFICRAENDGSAGPKFIGMSDCTYNFEWETKHACTSNPTSSQCFVDFNGVHIDLGDLAIGRDGNPWLAIRENHNDIALYYLNVCAEVPDSGLASACDPEAAACKIDKNGKSINLGKFISSPEYDPATRQLKIKYTGGTVCKSGKSRESTIIFTCRPGFLNTSPVLSRISEDDCVYEFEWFTSEACPEGFQKGKNCKVQDNVLGYSFDLNPLRVNNYYKVETLSYDYYINICGEVKNTPCNDTPDTLNAAGCKVQKTKDRKEKPLKIGEPSEELIYADGVLNLTYIHGSPFKTNAGNFYKTTIAFLCDHQAGVGKPEFIDEADNELIFNWYTTYACPKIFECTVVSSSSGKQYDLSRLGRHDDNWILMPSSTIKFYFNICHQLNTVSLPCSSSAAICAVKVENGTEVKYIPNLGQALSPLNIINENIELNFISGSPCISYGMNVNYSSMFHFLCVENAADEQIKFLDVIGNCRYMFLWLTRAACPLETVESEDKCTLKDPETGYIFDLSSLKKTRSSYSAVSGSRKFYVNICGSVSSECPVNQVSLHDSVSACEITGNQTKVIGLENKFKIRFQDGFSLSILYEGMPNEKGKIPMTLITFECQNEGDPTLEFLKEEENIFAFNLKTSLVCEPGLYQYCKFTDYNGNAFDMSPLTIDSGYNWEVLDERHNYETRRYHVNFCSPLNIVQNYSCPGRSTAACFTDINDSKKKGISLGYLTSKPSVIDNTLILRYEGGSPCNRTGMQFSARVTLSCSDIQEELTFVGESPTCEFMFSMKTPVACPIKTQKGQNCTVSDPLYGYHFDLSPLQKHNANYPVHAKDHNYVLNVCGDVSNVPPSCKGAAGCQLKDNMAISIGEPSGELIYKEGVIQLIYENGKGNCHKRFNRSTIITFTCRHSDSVSEGPSFISEAEDCTYMFEWPTQYACPPYHVQKCSIENDKGDLYDLSSLSLPDTNYIIHSEFMPNITFIINICRNLVHTPHSLCPYDSFVCMLNSTEIKPKKAVRNLGSISSGLVFNKDDIVINYRSGDVCSEPGDLSERFLESIVTFRCNKDAYDTKPDFYGNVDCTYHFIWETAAACKIEPEKVIRNNCTAVNPKTGFEFDFNVLRKAESYEVFSEANHVFYLNVCGGLSSNLCGDTAGSCQKEIKGTRNWNSGNFNNLLHYHGGILFLNYSGGSPCHKNQFKRNTIIEFMCGPEGTGLGEPEFLYESENCTYYFKWLTELACERNLPCYVDNGEETFDLSPLSHMENQQIFTTNFKNTTFFISLCHPLHSLPKISCPPGSAVCMVQDDKALSLGHPLHPPFVGFSDDITVIYVDGSPCANNASISYKTRLIFVCEHDESLNKLSYVSYDSQYCVFVFEWKTNVVCKKHSSAIIEPSCTFRDTNTGKIFDLTPLVYHESTFDIPFTDGKFSLNICGSIPESHNECALSSVCLYNSKGAENYGQFSSMQYSYDGLKLKQIFTNGSECISSNAGHCYSEIIYICDLDAGNGAPRLYKKLPCASIFIWRTSVVCVAEPPPCTMSVQGTIFDFRLLSSLTHNWNASDEDGSTYWINVCRGLAASPDSKVCPSNVAVCKKSKNGQVSPLGLASSMKFNYQKSDKIILSYNQENKNICSSNTNLVSTEIHFICGNRMGKPKFVSFDNCVYTFEWKTSLACPEENDDLIETKNGVLYDKRLNMEMNLSSIFSKTFEVKDREYIYFVNLGHGTGNATLKTCLKAAICQTKVKSSFYRDIGTISTHKFHLQGSELHLLFTSHGRKCGKNLSKNVTSIINLECSEAAGEGNPQFLYESSNCDYIFHWDTNAVCPSMYRASTHTSDHKVNTKTTSVAVQGFIAFLVIATLVCSGIILVKKERRASAIRACKGLFCNIQLPRFHYRKIDDDAVLICDHTTVLNRPEDSDVDIIT